MFGVVVAEKMVNTEVEEGVARIVVVIEEVVAEIRMHLCRVQ